ncbi:MAG: FAD:protein FMN transferase [Aliishimia sp.]
MTLSRRRLLTISAAFMCAPAFAQAQTWQGRAFGGDISLTLTGPRSETALALDHARKLIRLIEGLFSLYDTKSALSRLNQNGVLSNPDDHMNALLTHADIAYRQTSGLFDPTIQPLWAALANRTDPAPARRLIGWDRVRFDTSTVALDAGQALTFNGIAQGYATDLVTAALKQRGLTQVLVNIGEHRALGGPWKLALADPTIGHVGTRTIKDSAIATSSPSALSLGDQSHILHPNHHAIWSTVSVEARTATSADSLSTALVFAPKDQVGAIKDSDPDVKRITLIDLAGDVVTL